MSMSNATENDVLQMMLQGSDPSWRAGATQYLALFTADPGEAASLASEATYTGYARVALTKASAWTDGGSTFTNAALVQFGACTAGSSVITHFAVVDTSSGAGANTYTMAPKTREQWEAEREAARVQEPEAFTEREQAAAAEQPKRQRTPQIPLPLLFQGPKQPTTPPVEAPSAIVLPVPPVQVVADFTVTDEEAAAIATLLTARVNAYRRASTGNPTPIHWAA